MVRSSRPRASITPSDLEVTGRQVLRILTFPDDQGPLVFNAGESEFAIAGADPVPGAPDVVRTFDTCPACTNARALLSLAAPHTTDQLTVLEKTVVGNS